jgi:isoquinoline 1-oxidoreductase subunit beta
MTDAAFGSPWNRARVTRPTTDTAPSLTSSDAAPNDMTSGTVTRREFVTFSLVLAIGATGVRRLGAMPTSASADDWNAHAYLRIAEDGTVTISCHRSEMGQGIRTTMPMIIADELEADWARVRIEQGDGDEPRYGSQNTDGSTSIRDFLAKYREAGATARTLLEAAAAQTWRVPVADVRAEQHEVVHSLSGRRLGYGALVALARTLPMPVAGTVRVKAPQARRWQGRGMPSIDLVAMTTGTAVYGADVRLPGMRVAAIARPPVWGATVVRVDDRAALAVPGVERVVRVPAAPMPGGFGPLGGVAVIARDTWAAFRGRNALVVEWSTSAHSMHSTLSERSRLEATVRASGAPGLVRGDVDAALASATRRVSAEYHVPHLAHAAMEPVVAIARVANGRVEAWAPTQSPMDARKEVARFLGLDVSAVTMHVTLLGGGFGRKSKPDFICEAAWLAREAGAPVRVQWSREDDIRHSYYHSVAGHRIEAGFDSSGRVSAWRHRSAYPSIGATFDASAVSATPDELLNGASDLPYDIPNMRVEVGPVTAHARIGWYRSVNAIHHGFAIGSFIDELAHTARRDPAEFLLALIGADRRVDLRQAGLVGAPSTYYGAKWEDHPVDAARARHVVERVRAASGWGASLPRGRGRGIAMHRSFGTYVAMVVEVAVASDGIVHVPRAWVAVDAGFVANPDRAASQMEGALVMAMSNTLHSAITFTDGRVQQSNYADYRVARQAASPRKVSVEFVPGDGVPGGIGEPGVPPAGAAIGNAIFAATGVRVRSLPVGSQLAGWSARATSDG